MKGTFLLSPGYGPGFMASTGGHDAARAKGAAEAASQKVKVLEANLAKTLMICETLWELLRDEHGWSEESLHKKL